MRGKRAALFVLLALYLQGGCGRTGGFEYFRIDGVTAQFCPMAECTSRLEVTSAGEAVSFDNGVEIHRDSIEQSDFAMFKDFITSDDVLKKVDRFPVNLGTTDGKLYVEIKFYGLTGLRRQLPLVCYEVPRDAADACQAIWDWSGKFSVIASPVSRVDGGRD